MAVDASADMPPELADVKVRLRDVDTPEKGGRAKCPVERDAGQAATEFTEKAVADASAIVVRDPKWGKWGGRVIADLVLDNRSLSAWLIAAGHGRAYDGGRRGELVPPASDPGIAGRRERVGPRAPGSPIPPSDRSMTPCRLSVSIGADPRGGRSPSAEGRDRWKRTP